jgi:hypothetical protein
MKSTIKILVLTLFFAGLLGPASAQERVRQVKNFTVLNPSLSTNRLVELAIATTDLNIDLQARDNAIFRIKGVRNLLNQNENLNNIQLVVYDVTSSGKRNFVVTETLTVGVNRDSRVLIPVDLGQFISATRKLEVDLYDAKRNLVATYPVTVNAINLDTQVTGGNDPNRQFTCDGLDIEACIESFFVNNIDVIAKPRKQSSASIQRNPLTDRLELNVPFAREYKQFDGNRRRIKVNIDQTGTGTGLASFGETMDISRIRLGPSANDFANFRYDTGLNNFILSSGTNGNTLVDNFYFNDAGKLGIGVSAAPAYLSIRGGTTTMPQIFLDQGSLTTTLIDGAVEFDGNELYLTKNGVRRPIGTGATGATGPVGPQGPVGAQGPIGPQASLYNGGIINGPIAFTNNGAFLFAKGAQNGHLWTSDAAGNASWKAPAKNTLTPVAVSGAIDINAKTTIDVTGLNFVPLSDSNVATIDTLVTMTGGVIGQRVTLQIKDNWLTFDINTSGANRIFWGRGTAVGTRTQAQSEIFTFVFDGTNWFMVDRYIL